MSAALRIPQTREDRPPLEKVAVASITLDEFTQARCETDQAVAKDYADALMDGTTFPPLILYRDSDGKLYIGDGWTRVTAAKLAGIEQLDAVVRSGGRRDALECSIRVNAVQGQKLSPADKRRAVSLLLDDPEWSKLPDREIARRCGVTHPFVGKLKAERCGNVSAHEGEHVDTDTGRPPLSVFPPDDEPDGSASAPVAQAKPAPKAPKPTAEEKEIARGRKAGAIPEGEAVAVEAPPAEEAAAEPGPAAELPDAEWLETLPARAKLAEHCRAWFDQDAMAFRRATPSRVKHTRTCKQITNDAKRAGKGHIGAWMNRHFYYLKINDPSRWQACRKCEGKGSMPLGAEIIECPTCRGHGYQL